MVANTLRQAVRFTPNSSDSPVPRILDLRIKANAPCLCRSQCRNTLNAALRRMGYGKDEMTSHGFRAAASSLLNESGKWNPDPIEAQLAHVEGNAVHRAYARAEFWDERVRMMDWWGATLDRLRENNNSFNRPVVA